MYELYWRQDSGAFLPHALLAKAEAAFTLIDVDTKAGAHRSADYLALNPAGQIPTLVLPDRTVMTETAAMLLQLCDAFPAMELAPPPGERALFYRWTMFLAVQLYEAELRWVYPERYTDDRAGAAGVKAAAHARMSAQFRIFADHALTPGPFVLGHRFSAVDLYAAMLAVWHPPAREDRRIEHLVQTAMADAAIRPIWDQCALKTG